MSEKPPETGRLLAICIPTYNRVDKLRRCIESVLPLTGNGDVEICVSDNASTDSTGELLETYAKCNDSFRYDRRASNGGIDVNMLAVGRMARSKYIFWLGDDDIAIKSEMEKLVEYLKSADCDCLIAPLEPRTGGVFGSAEEFFAEYGMIGCDSNMHFSTILLRSEALHPQSVARYIGTYHLYAGAVVDYLCDRQAAGSCKAVIWDRPLCNVAKSDKTWSKEVEDVFYKKILQWWRLLPNEIRRSKCCKEAYSKYLWLVTNTLWARKKFRWRYVKESPYFSVLGLLKRSVSAFVGRGFRRGGVKYKLFRIGPFRFARRSKRARQKDIFKIKQGKVKGK